MCSKTYPDEYNICPQDGQTLKLVAKKSSGDIFDHLIDDKYKVARLIGRGGMGAVYEAIHTTMQRRVAIKILNPDLVSNPAAMERFRREALASGRLKHPNAITIYDYGTTNRSEAFIVMEYLEGCSLNQEIQAVGPMDPLRVARILAPACEAVHAAHQEGIIHRDLKPANIMLEKLRTGEVVKVLDFGIAKLAISSSPNVMNLTGTGIIGTPQYMSPEQCQAHSVDARTDVYSLGIIAYEMLSGSLPFDGPAPLAIVIAQVKQPPPRLREKRPEIPESVETVVMRALEKDPNKRQQTAEELANDFRRLIRELTPTEGIAPKSDKTTSGLDRKQEEGGSPAGPASRRTSYEGGVRVNLSGSITSSAPAPSELSMPPINSIPPRPLREPVSMPTYASMERFVGRTPELGTLRAAWQRARSGRGGRPVLIFGEPGIGKTRLAEELRERLEDLTGEEPPLILSGKFFEYGGAAPYQVLVEGLRPAVQSLFHRQLHEDQSLSPDDERFVSKAFLKALVSNDYLSVFGGTALGGGDQERFRIFEQLTRLFVLLARRRGVLLFLDDMQWADEVTLEFLAHLNRNTLTERVLVIVAMRSLILSIDTHPLRRWMRQLDEAGGFEQIMLPPLSNSEVRAMVEGMLNNAVQISANLIQLLAEETKGNPYYVGEVIRQMISNGQIRRDKTMGWMCNDVSEFDLPDSIAALVATQISRLKENVADILAQAAVIGEEFTFDLLQRVTELREEDLLDAVEAGLKAGILREVVASGEDRYVFAQSTVHRVLYKRISRRRRKRLHGRVAEHLEKNAQSASISSASLTKDRLAGDLAYHYFRAEDWSHAMQYAMEAAYIKWRTFAIGEAGKYYGWVAQGLQQLRAMEESRNKSLDLEIQKPDVLVQFHLNYGLLLIECARIEEAEQQLQQALALSQEHNLPQLGRTQAALGRLCNLQGFSEEALEYANAGLARLREIEDHAGVVAALLTIGEAYLSQGRHGSTLNYLEQALKAAERIDDRAGKAAVLSGFGQMYYQQGHYGQALTKVNQALAIARSLGNSFEERRNLNLLGNICLRVGQLEEAKSYYEPALNMACAFGHRPGEGASLSYLGDVMFLQDRYGEALENYQQAVRIARDVGNRAAEGRYLLNIGRVQLERGEYKAAMAALEQSLTIAWEAGSRHIEAETLCVMGDTYRRLGKFTDAGIAFGRAFSLAQELEYPHVAWQTAYSWALCEHAQGRTEEAKKHLSECIAIIEKLRSELPDDDDCFESFTRDKERVYELLEQVEKKSASLGPKHSGAAPPTVVSQAKFPESDKRISPTSFIRESQPTIVEAPPPAEGERVTTIMSALEQLARMPREAGVAPPPPSALPDFSLPAEPKEASGKEEAGEAIIFRRGHAEVEIPGLEAKKPAKETRSVNEVLSDLMDFANELGMDDLLDQDARRSDPVREIRRREEPAKEKGEKTKKKTGKLEKVKDEDVKAAEAAQAPVTVKPVAPPPAKPEGPSIPLTPVTPQMLPAMHLASSANSLETNWHQMLQTARAAGDRASERKALTLMASSLHSQGQTARARDNYQQALIIGRETQSRQGEAALLNNIGETFRHEGRYADALAYYRLALRSAREFKDDRAAEIALVNAALMYTKLGQIKEALSMLNQAQAANETTRDRGIRSECLQALAEVYWIQKEIGRALESSQEALAIARETGNSDIEWRGLWVIGRCRWFRQDRTGAIDALQESLAALDRHAAELPLEETRRRLLVERQDVTLLLEEWQRESGIRV
ncbi:MAG: tetratricopeptide repeat protein [Blastocatellia bacterium]|nr:tetratricopeptide repeat protein [Blastocatellia bacterium]